MMKPTDEELETVASRIEGVLFADPESKLFDVRAETLAKIAALLRACKGRDELVALLKEARDDLAAYVRSDWPEDTCEKYPSIATKYDRDMTLCRRIDAALAALEQEPRHE